MQRSKLIIFLSLKFLHLFGNPRMQILMPSSTPLQVSWCMMSGHSTCYPNGQCRQRSSSCVTVTSPGFLWVFGTRQRTKWGSQLCLTNQLLYLCINDFTMNADVNEGHQSRHQLDEGDEVDGGDSLAATLLLLLALLFWRHCRLAGMI